MQNDGPLSNPYRERNMLIAHLSKIYPSHLCMHEESDKTWDKEWRIIVCVHGPKGEMAWHIHDDERRYFDHLIWELNHFDGHITEEKYNRLLSINPKADE